MKFALLPSLLLAASSVFGQTAPPGGVSSEWDVRKLLDSLDQEAQHLKPIIDQVKPEPWVAKGAPNAYIAQWRTAQAQLKYFLASSDGLARQPEKLTLALDAYFRMQSMETMVGSVLEGVRKYQNPALAVLMQNALAENSANRDRLRQYLQDLAKQKEDEFMVADREAQRCRAAMLGQPVPKTKKVAQ